MLTLVKPKRTVVVGNKYLHFKGNVYVVNNFSNPNPLKDKLSMNIIMTCNFVDVLHSDGYPIRLLEHKGRLYHDPKVEQRHLVIYHNVDNPNILYARPIKEFLSEVDKEKYPNATQRYRLEEVIED